MDTLAASIRKKMGSEYAGLKSCVLAYSGGLDSQVIGSILQEWGVKVYPIIFQMGGRSENSAAVAQKAKQRFGSAQVVDITADIVRAAERGVKTNCLLAGHLNSGGFSRPFMARALVEAAHRLNVTAVAHGASGTGNDHLRLDLALRALAPELRVMAPVRDWDLRRDDALAYAKRRRWPLPSHAAHFSADENIWGRSVRQGVLVDPQAPLPAGAWAWTVDGEKAPASGVEVEIEFKQGIAIGATIYPKGKKIKVRRETLIATLNKVGGAQGIGRQDAIVDKVIGLKMRELHEGPAAALLVAAHADLEKLCLTKAELDVKGSIDRRWNQLVYDGGWHHRLRYALDAFVDETQRAVSGHVRLRLHRGQLSVMGRGSERGLYDHRLGRRDKDGMLSQTAVRSFARLYGLQETMASRVQLEG
jgi:argininosuccinate synthase